MFWVLWWREYLFQRLAFCGLMVLILLKLWRIKRNKSINSKSMYDLIVHVLIIWIKNFRRQVINFAWAFIFEILDFWLKRAQIQFFYSFIHSFFWLNFVTKTQVHFMMASRWIGLNYIERKGSSKTFLTQVRAWKENFLKRL